MDGRETEHLYLDIPNPGRKQHRVTSVFVGEGELFEIALARGYGGSRKELVRGPYRATLLAAD